MDSLVSVPGVMACQVAPDELMLLGALGDAASMANDAARRARAVDPDALVVDATDGWATWTLRGDDVHIAFGRLSAVPFTAGFSQGDVAHVPVKIVASRDTLDLLVPAKIGRAHV